MPGVNVLLFGLSFVYGTAALNCFGSVCPIHEICEVVIGDKSGHCKHKGPSDHETCPVVTRGHCFCEHQPCIDNMNNQFHGGITGLDCFGHVCPSTEICEVIIGGKYGLCKHKEPADHETCPVVTHGQCLCKHQSCIEYMKNNIQCDVVGLSSTSQSTSPTTTGPFLECGRRRLCPHGYVCEHVLLHNHYMSRCVSLTYYPACSASVLPAERSPCYCSTTDCNIEVIKNLQNFHATTQPPTTILLHGLTLAPDFFIGLAPAPVVCADADTDSCEIITKLTTNFCTSSFAVKNCAKSCKICTTPSL